jgi:sugar phosphate isomerase/epimerase
MESGEMAQTRRAFFGTVASSFFVFQAGELTRARRQRIPLAAVAGSWLFDANAETKLRALADIGCRQLEAQLDSLFSFRRQISDAGISMPSAFIRTPIVTGTWDVWRSSRTAVERGIVLPPGDTTLNETIERARSVPGLRNLTVVILLPEERSTLDDYRRLAEAMNHAGEACSRAGLTLSYHCHAFEFGPHDGTTPFDLLIERFDPKLVQFELDVFWMAVAGRDPLAFMRAHGRRISGLHLKDMSATAPKPFYGSPWDMPTAAIVPLGDGVTDWRAVLRQARQSDLAHAYVEDESAGDRYQNLLRGLRYLKTLHV